MVDDEFWVPDASRQVRFHQHLVAARKLWLMGALGEALKRVDPIRLKQELGLYVPVDAQQILAGAGIRDEHVFPAPVVLEAAPALVGYYRLLLGVPQKTFYGSGTGMGMYRSMERSGFIQARQQEQLPQFCSRMCRALADLVRQIRPRVTPQDIHDLPLLTLGSQIQGGNNNVIGQRATADAFLVIAETVRPYTVDRTERTIAMTTPPGRRFVIMLASDPDVAVYEIFGNERLALVAIEIKGGTDKSNVHNRAGEAEKSHLKARDHGFGEFWTVIATAGLDLQVLRRESPTTTAWFDAGEVLGQGGPGWGRFRQRLAAIVGVSTISDTPAPEGLSQSAAPDRDGG